MAGVAATDHAGCLVGVKRQSTRRPSTVCSRFRPTLEDLFCPIPLGVLSLFLLLVVFNNFKVLFSPVVLQITFSSVGILGQGSLLIFKVYR